MNRLGIIKIVSGFLVFVGSRAIAADAVEYHLCRLKETVRSVRVITSADNRCMTVYAKEGKDQIMGNTSDLTACDDYKKNILKNLKEGGFDCITFQNPSFTFIVGEEND